VPVVIVVIVVGVIVALVVVVASVVVVVVEELAVETNHKPCDLLRANEFTSHSSPPSTSHMTCG
jgi:hypothetical protein